MDAQSAVSFVDRFLVERFHWACWSGLDGEGRWVINKFAQFGGGDQAKAAFGDGEGSPRSSVGIVGELGGVLKFVDVDCWWIGSDVGARRDGEVVRKA